MRVIAATLALGLAAVAAGSSRAASTTSCARYAAAPERVFHGDDFEFVHTAASAMYCPNDVYVQITACVQRRWPQWACLQSRRSRRWSRLR